MPKVFGTGVFEFRHPRAAEYPLPADAAAPATAAAPDKVPASTGGGSITLLDIQRDRLTRVATEHWGTPAAASAFDADLVRKIYATELCVEGRGRKTVPLQRVMILEVSQYLENYLWPHFDPADASFEHVMSIILMVNEKVSLCPELDWRVCCLLLARPISRVSDMVSALCAVSGECGGLDMFP
jgi:intron-binding protein aquarius